ncbi:hypothetical protein RintRC_7114 [Richelia intracellularis]|nr:hypothetical protein RintRC_7114 [Richelia intracellularis]
MPCELFYDTSHLLKHSHRTPTFWKSRGSVRMCDWETVGNAIV